MRCEVCGKQTPRRFCMEHDKVQKRIDFNTITPTSLDNKLKEPKK